MPGRDERASGRWGNGPRGRVNGAVLLIAAFTRTLEAESDRLSLWIPVLFAGGILIYFGLPEEPRLLSAAALVMAATGIYLAARGTGLGLVVGGAALALAAGFATAKLHTEMARAPVLTKEMRGVTVKGWVELYEPRDKARARITLRVITLGELPPEETPYRVRVTLPAASAKVATGEAVSLKATLRPPPEPIVPNGFDFGRTAWFDRLGATGYGTGTIEALADAGEAPFGLRLWAAIDRLRSLVNARIRACLPGERGEIATALITGERAGISQDVNQAMRNSGLFHILSISGLHMVIMAGTVFWLVRAGLCRYRLVRLTPATQVPPMTALTKTSASTAIQMSDFPLSPVGRGWGEGDCDSQTLKPPHSRCRCQRQHDLSPQGRGDQNLGVSAKSNTGG